MPPACELEITSLLLKLLEADARSHCRYGL